MIEQRNRLLTLLSLVDARGTEAIQRTGKTRYGGLPKYHVGLKHQALYKFWVPCFNVNGINEGTLG